MWQYAEAAMKLDETLGGVSIGLKTVPYVANTANIIGKKVDTVLQFGTFGDLKTSSRYVTGEKALTNNPNIKTSGLEIV